jgi:hypothetical protein
MENSASPDGKCIKCKSQKAFHYHPFFFAKKGSDNVTGAYFVPICSSCILKKRIFSIIIGTFIIFAVFVTAQIVLPKYATSSAYGSGIIWALILIYLFTTPNIGLGSSIAGNLLRKELGKGLSEVNISGDVKKYIRHNWHKIKKHFVCPGCHRIIKGHPPTCPACSYELPKLMPSL